MHPGLRTAAAAAHRGPAAAAGRARQAGLLRVASVRQGQQQQQQHQHQHWQQQTARPLWCLSQLAPLRPEPAGKPSRHVLLGVRSLHVTSAPLSARDVSVEPKSGSELGAPAQTSAAAPPPTPTKAKAGSKPKTKPKLKSKTKGAATSGERENVWWTPARTMHLNELRAMLDERGLDAEGSKDELVERIEAAVATEGWLKPDESSGGTEPQLGPKPWYTENEAHLLGKNAASLSKELGVARAEEWLRTVLRRQFVNVKDWKSVHDVRLPPPEQVAKLEQETGANLLLRNSAEAFSHFVVEHKTVTQADQEQQRQELASLAAKCAELRDAAVRDGATDAEIQDWRAANEEYVAKTLQYPLAAAQLAHEEQQRQAARPLHTAADSDQDPDWRLVKGHHGQQPKGWAVRPRTILDISVPQHSSRRHTEAMKQEFLDHGKLQTPLSDAASMSDPERKFAVVELAGAQHKVTAGDTVALNRLVGTQVGERYDLKRVLLVGSHEWTAIGRPYLPGARVRVVVLEHARDAKVIAFKMRRRKNSRTLQTNRHLRTVLLIESIEYDV